MGVPTAIDMVKRHLSVLLTAPLVAAGRYTMASWTFGDRRHHRYGIGQNAAVVQLHASFARNVRSAWQDDACARLIRTRPFMTLLRKRLSICAAAIPRAAGSTQSTEPGIEHGRVLSR
jgi:hypothetical protein